MKLRLRTAFILVSLLTSFALTYAQANVKPFIQSNEKLILETILRYLDEEPLQNDAEFKNWLEQNKWSPQRGKGIGSTRDIGDIPVIGGFDQSAILNSVARVITKRFQETINSYFFEEFQKAMKDDVLLGTLFPLTKRTLTVAKDKLPELTTLQVVFERDLQNMFPNTLTYVEREMPLSEEQRRFFAVLRFFHTIYERILDGEDPKAIFLSLDEEELSRMLDDDVLVNAIQWLKVIAKYDLGQFEDEDFRRYLSYYIFFTLEKEYKDDALNILFGVTENVGLDDDFTWLIENATKEINTFIERYINDVITISKKYEQMRANMDTLKYATNISPYLDIVDHTLDLIIATKNIIFVDVRLDGVAALAPKVPKTIEETAESYFALKEKVDAGADEAVDVWARKRARIEYLFERYKMWEGIFSRIVEYGHNRNYNALIIEIVGLLETVYEEREEILDAAFRLQKGKLLADVNNAEGEEEKAASLAAIDELEQRYKTKLAEITGSEAFQTFLKYGRFIAIIAMNSDDPDALDKAIESILPPLSPMVKRKTKFGIYLNSYVGIDVGAEFIGEWDTISSQPLEMNSFDLSAPIGFEFLFWGYWGVFIYPIDLGPLVTYYVEGIGQDDVQFGFDKAFAPGIFAFSALGDTPFIAGLGYQYLPELRTGSGQDEHRFTFTFAVDIPLMEFYRIEK